MQSFDFEIQGICSNINGNSRFWQSFDFVVEKKSKPKQNVNLLVLPQVSKIAILSSTSKYNLKKAQTAIIDFKCQII